MRTSTRSAFVRVRIGITLGVFVALSLASAAPASATHDARRFELDANAVSSSAWGDDWSVVAPTDRSSTNIVASFVADGSGAPSDASYFTGGGSKDLNDVTAWRHTPGDVAPEKNEITHAFASAYRNGRDTGRNDVGDLLVYFGLDRYANNGDAQVGFWFFRSSVGMRADGTFSGRHSVGDLLVLSHFTQGGRVSDINVYSWVGSGGSDGALDLVTTGRDCAETSPDDPVCSSVNAASTDAPWSYTPKSGPAGAFPQGSFYEGGINVTRLLPAVTCFKAFMAETRSSQSVDAQLKDLALGPFDTCPTVTAAPPRTPGSAPGITSAPILPETGREALGPLGWLGLGLIALGSALRSAGARGLRSTRAALAAQARVTPAGGWCSGQAGRPARPLGERLRRRAGCRGRRPRRREERR